MYLKSLTLKGFKSFAQATTFAFEPGVTCVVGPNGSGKSNVVDALAWVMGEQGVKSLRGGKMEDVIFAGTATRGPLGRAEVTLTIDNSDGVLPIEYSEVTISRTLFRNGGSEYAINGDSCRLLDVQELLSDTGLGRQMHVIVGQGQLDSVLHATPEDRRGFIEEAAGILKHRRRKEKTLRKLEAMQTNLTRLSDLAGEIRRQLKPLGRQAEIAREAQSIAAQLRDARSRLIADDVVTLKQQLASFQDDEQARNAERIVLQEQAEQKRLRVTHLESAQLGQEVDRARSVAHELESVQERLRGLHTLTVQKIALLAARDNDPEVVPVTTRVAVDQARAEAEALREAIAEAESAFVQAQAGTVESRKRLDAVDEEIAAQSALISSHELQLSKLTGQVDTHASRLAAVRGEELRLRNGVEAATQRREIAEKALAELDGDGPSASEVQDELSAAYEGQAQAVSEAETRIELTRNEVHTLERERDALQARVGVLARALDQKDGNAALVAATRPGVRGLVAEHVRVQAGYEAAIAAVLETRADAVLVAGEEAALKAMAYTRAEGLGRVEMVVEPEGSDGDVGDVRYVGDVGGVRDMGDVPTGLVAAVSVVTAPTSVLALLSGVYVADDLESARAAWIEWGGREGQPAESAQSGKATEEAGALAGVEPARALASSVIVTREGEVLSRFVVRGGEASSMSRLELVSDREAATARLAEVGSALEQARHEHDEQRQLLNAAKNAAAAALGALRAQDSRLAEQSEKRSRLLAQGEAARAECERLDRQLLEAAKKVREAESALEKAKSDVEVQASVPRPILDVSGRDELAEALEKAREREVEARLSVETARERVRVALQHAEELAVRHKAEEAAAQEAARRAVVRRRQLAVAESVAAALPPVLASVEASVTQARLEFAQVQQQRESENRELAALRAEEAALRERLQAVSESVHGLELQLYEKRLHLSNLLERAAGELGLDEDVLLAEYGPELPLLSVDEDGQNVEKPFDRKEQQRRLEQAERAMERLGRVNPLALEEFAALEQRHQFLTEQLADLTKTRTDLLAIIDELDATMQTVFAAAFDDVTRAFAEVFPVLFPGGSGNILLTDPESALTTGIEVTIRPAGKKVERLSLLSGGERSLAAVAFLVAIFMARPSPFYIMDEVEAALDDANLGRLLQIFETLRESSQLIVITHQKRTMEIADALYGVSMRADGVSAVIGQRLTQSSAAEAA